MTHVSFWIGALRTLDGKTVLIREGTAGGALEEPPYSHFNVAYPSSGCVTLDRLNNTEGTV